MSGIVSEVRERLRLRLKGLRHPIGVLPRAHSGRLSSTRVGAALQPQPDWILLRSRLIGGPRDLASVARYDEQDLPLFKIFRKREHRDLPLATKERWIELVQVAIKSRHGDDDDKITEKRITEHFPRQNNE